jgi:RimJ/RimL family protein N-acetyltransferase
VIERTIEGIDVRLRPFRESDTDDVAAACADPLTQRFIPAMPHPYTMATARWWVAEGSVEVWATGGAVFAVADPATDRLLGSVGLDHVLPTIRGQAEIGYWVVPRARGRGVAVAATRTLAARALDGGIARLELLTELENGASQRVALAAGFRREGIRRAAGAGRGGGRHDLLAWARLAGDPAGPTPRILPDLPGGGLTDGVVTLRRTGPDDSDFLYGLHGLPEVAANRIPPVAPDRNQINQRCAHAEARWLAGESADLIIVDAASGLPAGGCALFYQDRVTGQASIGYSVLPPWRGRGTATRAVRLLAGWAFDTVGINRLAASTRAENIGSQRVLAKAGFRHDGLLHGRYPGTDGQRIDEVLFGLLPADLPH